MHVEHIYILYTAHLTRMQVWGDASTWRCGNVCFTYMYVCLCVCHVDMCISEHAFPHTEVYGEHSHASVTIIRRYDSWSLESAPTSGSALYGAALWELLSSHWTGYRQVES